jgi:hypothetical protein
VNFLRANQPFLYALIIQIKLSFVSVYLTYYEAIVTMFFRR